MGALDHLSDMCSVTETKRTLQIRKRRPLQVKNITMFEPFCFRGIRREIISSACSLPLNLLRFVLIISSCLYCFRFDQTVDLKVKMDCDGCERRVKHAVSSIRGTWHASFHFPFVYLRAIFSLSHVVSSCIVSANSLAGTRNQYRRCMNTVH